MDTRCCWPPDSWLGRLVELGPQAHPFQGSPGPLVALPGGDVGVDQGHLHVFHQVQLGQQVVLLENEAQHLVSDPGQFVLVHPAHIPAVEPIGAGGGHIQAADDVHAGGFARARLAHNGHELPFLDLHRDVVGRLDGGVPHLVVLADRVKFDQCAHRGPAPPPPAGAPPPPAIPPPGMAPGIMAMPLSLDWLRAAASAS